MARPTGRSTWSTCARNLATNVCDPVSGLCDPYLFATATDTTTVAPAHRTRSVGRRHPFGEPRRHGDIPRHDPQPHRRATISTISSISAAWFWGNDGLNHPTELWIDSTGNGDPDTQIAVDLEGDGTWDVGSGFSLTPNAAVAADTILAYELRRPIDLLQSTSRDPVTLTALPRIANDEDSITATVLVAAATAAVLADFEAYGVNGQVVVEWRTSAELGTIGFDLLRWTTGETDFQKVNGHLVPGLRHLQGGTYQLVDHDTSVGDQVVYYLHEYDVWGTGTTFGPFEVEIEERGSIAKAGRALAAGLAREVNKKTVRLSGQKSGSIGGTASGLVKIMVREDGLVRLSAHELAAALGSEPAVVSDWIANGNLWIGSGTEIAPPDTSLFSDGFESGGTQGWDAPVEAPDEPDGVAWMALEDNSGLVFWGEAIDSIYTRDNVYWIGVGRGLLMKTRSAAAAQPEGVGSFSESIHLEEEQWPLTSVMTEPEADFWMWDYFFPYDGEPVVTKIFPVSTPAVALSGGTARLSVKLQGSYETEVPNNHKVGLRLNGQNLGGPWQWSDHDELPIDIDFPQEILNDGDNSLEITATLVEGLDFDEFYVDSIDISYQRLHVAAGDQLHATGGGAPVVAVTGFSSDEILVFDLTDNRKPVVLTGVLIAPSSGGFSANFGVTSGAMPFVATTLEALSGPSALVVDFESNLKDPANRGRYVVVAGPGLEGEAAALAAYREQQGLPAVVAPVTDIYDEFNGGVVSPWAIRDFLKHAFENWDVAAGYVFLAGDGTLDYKNIWGARRKPGSGSHDRRRTAVSCRRTTLLRIGSATTACRRWPSGRLPAQSAAELAIYREKIAAFEAGSGDWKTSGALACRCRRRGR